jgi:hypothetical protein
MAEEVAYSPDYSDMDYFSPSQNEIPNHLNTENHPLEELEKQLSDSVSQKRHLGAVARLSGTKQRNEPFPGLEFQLPKRHLGAFAALSGMRQPSSRTNGIKRHLGSAGYKNGFRSSISAIGRSLSSDNNNLTPDKRHVGAVARTNLNKNFNRIGKSNIVQEYSTENEFTNPNEQFSTTL